MKPAVEGYPYPVFIDEELVAGIKKIALRIGPHGRGENQSTLITLREARLLAYALLREVEEREVKIERLNDELRRLNEEAQSEVA